MISISGKGINLKPVAGSNPLDDILETPAGASGRAELREPRRIVQNPASGASGFCTTSLYENCLPVNNLLLMVMRIVGIIYLISFSLI